MWQKRFYYPRDEAGGDGEVGGGGGEGDPWYAGLVEEGTEVPGMLKESQDFDSFLKQAVHFQGLQGSSIRIPGENASEEDRAAFYEKLTAHVPGLIPTPDPENEEAMKAYYARVGVPEDRTGYELPVPEGAQVDESLQNWFLDTASSSKLSKAQAESLYRGFNELSQARDQEFRDSMKAQDAELRKEWGATYDPQIKKIKTLWSNYPEFKELADNAEKGLVPSHVFKGFAKLAEGLMGEGFTMLGDEGHQNRHVVTPTEAANQVQETIKKLAKLEPSDPERGPLMKQLIELQKQAMPEADHTPPARAGFSS